jgi:hypothetical protein
LVFNFVGVGEVKKKGKKFVDAQRTSDAATPLVVAILTAIPNV